MLYSESRKNRQKSYHQVAIALICALYGALMTACNPNGTPAEAAAQQRLHLLIDSAQDAKAHLEHLIYQSHDSLKTDIWANEYYKKGGEWLWVTPSDTSRMEKAALMANYLRRKADEMGFSPDAFYADTILRAIEHFKRLDFDSTGTSVIKTMASLELNATKGCLRYAAGQRYGFMNPHQVLNRLDSRKGGGFRIVYDIDLEQPDEQFPAEVLSHIPSETIAWLDDYESPHTLYQRLKELLVTDSSEQNRLRMICNMERLRWRHLSNPAEGENYVFVNIPSQQLWAVRPDSVFSMRICCGAWATKTPLLTSTIRLIQLNPEWNIPGSILRDEVSTHAGDSAYFARNRYFVIQRRTGDTINPRLLSAQQLRSGSYRVAQHSGPRNSLGRIIFRFNNQFDVYLHDTNNRSVFNNERRTVSHGCVRIQRPFDMAKFLLPHADEWLLDRIRMNIDLPPEGERGKKYKREHIDDEEPLAGIKMNSTTVSPAVTVVIDYYTYYPNPETGAWEIWPDRYEYDRQILKTIKPFLP